MDYNKLAELLFPHITKTPEEYEALYPGYVRKKQFRQLVVVHMLILRF